MQVDDEQAHDGDAFPLDADWWLRHFELRRQAWMICIEQRRNRQIMEQRPEQPTPGSLAANGKVARMMAAMGYVPGMPLRKSQSGSGVSADQDFGEPVELRAADARGLQRAA
jgi:hypothetical protein